MSKPSRPVLCDYCSRPAALVHGDAIYPHRPDLYERWFWSCAPCGAFVGTHADSPRHQPLGRLANAELRQAKSAAHAAFDPIWRDGVHTRDAAYTALAWGMQLAPEQAHIGMFSVDQCRQLTKIAPRLMGAYRARSLALLTL